MDAAPLPIPPPAGWNARWAWTQRHETHPWNRYVLFRKTVDLPQRPRQATVRISADSRYTLYVNAKRVHFGPSRSFPAWQSYDVLDLAPFLNSGRNVIAVIVHSFGVPTFQSVHRDAAGLIVDGAIAFDSAADIHLHTPDGWLCRDAKGWRQTVARLSIQLGFQEHYDADADPSGWMDADFDPTPEDGWKSPAHTRGVGDPPWFSMESRVVPLLTDHVESFVAVGAQFHGENARGYKVAEDVYRLFAKENRRKDKNLLTEAEHCLRDDESVTTIMPPEDSEFAMAMFDPGVYRTGHLRLDIAEAEGDEIIDVIYAEELDKSGAPEIWPVDGCQVGAADRYRCRAGAQSFEVFGLRGMRHLALVFRNLRKPLKLRHVAFRHVHADLPEIGTFQCSDESLNQIWAVARHTQINCALDAFVDCPSREQAQWWGDARVQAKVTQYAFGDSTLLARGIEMVAQSQMPDGTLSPIPPTDCDIRLPDFMLTWIETLWDHHFQTGETALVEKCLPVAKRLFEFFAGHEGVGGLIGAFHGLWVFLDWADLHKADYSGVLNILYLQGFRTMSRLCRLVGDGASADAFAAKAERLTTTLEDKFFDPDARLFRDGWDPASGERADKVSQHMNAWAILLGLKPESHPSMAKEVLLKGAKAKRGKIVTASPFGYAYILQALFQSGLKAEAMEIMAEKWGGMLDAGATTFWEGWVNTSSRCHAWAASPLYLLSQQVLGVIPTAPGFARVRIEPFCGDLDFAKGVVPTPPGPIRVEWERVGDDQLAVRVDLPEGIDAEFIDPTGARRPLRPGSQEFNT